MDIDYDLNGWATVILPRPPTLTPMISLGGDNMAFETLRAAVIFAMEELDENERAVCWIVTDSGPIKDVGQIEELYRIIALESG